MFTVGPGLRDGARVCDAMRPNVVLLGLMEGTDGSIVIPELISGVNLQANNGAALATGTPPTPGFPFGSSAAAFDGVNDYLGHALADFNVHSTPYTIDAWICPTNLALGLQGIISTDTTTSSVQWNFYVLVAANGTLGYNLRSGAGSIAVNSPAGSIAQGAWTHVEVGGDGAGTQRMWINGTHVASGTTTAYTTNTPGVVAIGAHSPTNSNSTFWRFFAGRIKAARITVGATRHTGTASFVPPNSLADYSICT